MLYIEDQSVEEDARVAGLEAHTANAMDKAAPHIIQRFVNIYDHLATTLFNPKLLSQLYPDSNGQRVTIPQLTFTQKRFKDHVDRYGYLNMSACPVPSVVGLKGSLLDYSMALANYTDFGTRVAKTLDETYRLLAEVLNANDALGSISTTSRFVGIDTHLKYRARYGADMQRIIGETKPTTEIPYGKLVRSNKEFIQIFDHRNSFERTLDEQTKNKIEQTVNKIANLMNNVATDVTRDNAEVNGRVVSALSNLLFEIGQMTRDYGTYLFRINELIGVVDGVTSEVLGFVPEHVKEAISEATAGNNDFDAGLNGFNLGGMGKLLIAAIVGVLGVVAAFVTRSKKSSSGDSKGAAAAKSANEYNEVMAQKPKEKAKEAIATSPEVIKPVVVAQKAGKTEVKPIPAPSHVPADGGVVKVDERPAAALKIINQIASIWNILHDVERDGSAPAFNADAWCRSPIMPYEVRSKSMDLMMCKCLWYDGYIDQAAELEKKYIEVATRFAAEVKQYRKTFDEFLKYANVGKSIPEGVKFTSEYMLKGADKDTDDLLDIRERLYPTDPLNESDSSIADRLRRYSTDEMDHIDSRVIEKYMDIAHNARQNVDKMITPIAGELTSLRDMVNKSLREVEKSISENASLAREYGPHIHQLRNTGIRLSGLANRLNTHYVVVGAAESVVMVGIEQFRTFGRLTLKLGNVLNKK